MSTARGIRYPFPIHHDWYHWPTFSDAEFARRHQIERNLPGRKEIVAPEIEFEADGLRIVELAREISRDVVAAIFQRI